MMSQSNKVQYSQGHVPFSWENKPGVSKVTNQESSSIEDHLTIKLPPPPCPIESTRISTHDIQIPLPPCAFQPPSRSCSKKGLSKHEDPFFAAYKECTKSTRKGKVSKNDVRSSVLKKGIFNFSCMHSCSVRDDNLVRISQLPYERDSERGER